MYTMLLGEWTFDIVFTYTNITSILVKVKVIFLGKGTLPSALYITSLLHISKEL